MVVRELDIKQNEIVYVGAKHGSSFMWIGRRKNLPVKLEDREVFQTYEHDTDYVGTVIIIEGEEQGKYWFYWECNHNVKPKIGELTCNQKNLEDFLIAIVRSAISEYRQGLLDGIRGLKNPGKKEVEEVIRNRRKKHKDVFEFCEDIESAKYAIKMVEDEIRIMCRYPKYKKMTGVTATRFFREKRQELEAERAKAIARKRYARIHGRLINADTKSSADESEA